MKRSFIFKLFAIALLLAPMSLSAGPSVDYGVDLSNVTITGGSITGTNITVGAGKTLNVSSGTLTLADDQIAGAKVADATTTSVGVAELATSAEAVAGTDISRIVTPAGNAASEAVIKNPLAYSQGVYLTASATVGGIYVADSDQLDMGTGNFKVRFVGMLPDYTPSAIVYLLYKYQDASHCVLFYVSTTGYLCLNLNGTVYTSSATLASLGITDGFFASFGATVTVGAVNTLVDFYANGYALGTQQTAANPGSVTNSGALYVMGTSTTRYAGAVVTVQWMNRAFTAAEVLDLYRNGLNYADKYGSQTAVYTSDFSAGVDGWSDTNSDKTGNKDGITDGSTSKDNCMEVVANATSYCDMWRQLSAAYADKNYILSFDVYVPATNATGVKIYVNTVSGTGSVVYTVGNVWTRIVHLSKASTFHSPYNSMYPLIALATSAGVTNAGITVGDKFYITNINSYPAGATLDLSPESIQPAPGQWLDSANKLHAMQPATGSSLTRFKKEFEFRWTNTWTASSAAQYIGGLNQAVMTADHYITSIVTQATVTTDVENLTLGDGSDADRFVAAFAPSATRTSQTIANQNDGTNLKLVYTPAAECTMTVETIIRGFIWEP